MLLNNAKIPPYSHQSSSFESAKIGSDDLINTLHAAGYGSDQLKRIEQTLDLMFELHKGQVRLGDTPYINHTLLVAKVLVKKFEVTSPAAVVAALLHDAPEDQAKKINSLLGNVISEDKELACILLSDQLYANPKEVLTHLRALTNPDFDRMAALLKGASDSFPLLQHKAEELLRKAQLTESDPREQTKNHLRMDISEIKRKLYLGHWCEIIAGDRETLAIKLSDFYSNGMHLHLLARNVEALADDSPHRELLREQVAKLAQKYTPVTTLIEKILLESEKTGVPVISEKADRLLRLKIRSALIS